MKRQGDKVLEQVSTNKQKPRENNSIQTAASSCPSSEPKNKDKNKRKTMQKAKPKPLPTGMNKINFSQWI